MDHTSSYNSVNNVDPRIPAAARFVPIPGFCHRVTLYPRNKRMDAHEEVHGQDNKPDGWFHLALCDAQQRDAEGGLAPDSSQN